MNPQTEAAYATTRPWTWRDRLRTKLFPYNPCGLPEAPPEWKDVLTCRTISHLSFLDRLRVLFSGRIQVETQTVTENIQGGAKTSSAFTALPPRWWERP